MREIRQSGSVGGETPRRLPYLNRRNVERRWVLIDVIALAASGPRTSSSASPVTFFTRSCRFVGTQWQYGFIELTSLCGGSGRDARGPK